MCELNTNCLPNHIGIIMDGNGRWAKERNQVRTFGHKEGLKRAKEIAKKASDLGIKFLTLYAFSTENWKRTEQEVSFLMDLIHIHLRQELNFYKSNQIRVKILGDKSGLPEVIQNDINQSEEDTKNFTGLTICLAINYGGQDSILRSVNKYLKNNPSCDTISKEDLLKNFDIPELPEADLIIRTGGEKRLSNFLLWQSAYSELIFNDILWPDYKENNFINDLIEFQNRTRKFGAVPV